jgi:hypothetical protein
MSLSLYANNVSQLTRQIADLQVKASRESQRKAQTLQQISNLRQSISKNISSSQLASKEKQIAHLTNQLSNIEKCQSDINKNLAAQEHRLAGYQEKLAQEQAKQLKKQQNEDRQIARQRAHQNAQQLKQLREINLEREQARFFPDFSIYTSTQTTESSQIISLIAQDDYQTLRKQDKDGYQLFLNDLLLSHIGQDSSSLLQISFYLIESQEICRVSIKPSLKPIFIINEKEEQFWIRAGNSTRKLSISEAIDYCKQRWSEKSDR